jgi:transcriptional regulator with XRE-family HTH domain
LAPATLTYHTLDLQIKRMPTLDVLSRGCPTSCMAPVPKLIREALRELREARHLSRSQLSRQTVALGDPGVSESTIEALEMKAGRVPDASTLEALARTLDVEPDTFYEYPIAVARREGRGKTAAAVTRAREAEALRGRAQQRSERPADAPGTTPARRGRGGRAS